MKQKNKQKLVKLKNLCTAERSLNTGKKLLAPVSNLTPISYVILLSGTMWRRRGSLIRHLRHRILIYRSGTHNKPAQENTQSLATEARKSVL